MPHLLKLERTEKISMDPCARMTRIIEKFHHPVNITFCKSSIETSSPSKNTAGAESRKREHASFCLFLILLPTSLLFFFPSSFLSRFPCLSSLPLPCLCPCLSSCLFLSVFSPCLCLSSPASLPLCLSLFSPFYRLFNANQIIASKQGRT